ncbi:MAG: hypothetical protein DMG59_12990 [Acidobacteria bacterium]|nr:MAG: hypothetical protein DMG59_12990 [Acidobacteriota bacterium]
MQWLLILFLALDLSSIKTDPNLERRSDRALDNANSALDAARDAYTAGDAAKTQAELDEVGESVDLAYQSLVETGKDARRSSKFKHAELKTRELMRRLDGLRQTFNFDDRGLVDKVRDRVAQVHDDLLKRIMSKKKR